MELEVQVELEGGMQTEGCNWRDGGIAIGGLQWNWRVASGGLQVEGCKWKVASGGLQVGGCSWRVAIGELQLEVSKFRDASVGMQV